MYDYYDVAGISQVGPRGISAGKPKGVSSKNNVNPSTIEGALQLEL